jgi:hypothetical protein
MFTCGLPAAGKPRCRVRSGRGPGAVPARGPGVARRRRAGERGAGRDAFGKPATRIDHEKYCPNSSESLLPVTGTGLRCFYGLRSGAVPLHRARDVPDPPGSETGSIRPGHRAEATHHRDGRKGGRCYAPRACRGRLSGAGRAQLDRNAGTVRLSHDSGERIRRLRVSPVVTGAGQGNCRCESVIPDQGEEKK